MIGLYRYDSSKEHHQDHFWVDLEVIFPAKNYAAAWLLILYGLIMTATAQGQLDPINVNVGDWVSMKGSHSLLKCFVLSVLLTGFENRIGIRLHYQGWSYTVWLILHADIAKRRNTFDS